MVKGKTASGFEFEIDPRNIQDMAFLDLLDEIEGGNPLRWGRVARVMLGDDQKRKFYDYLKDEDGHVPVERTIEELGEMLDIVNNASETKNS